MLMFLLGLVLGGVIAVALIFAVILYGDEWEKLRSYEGGDRPANLWRFMTRRIAIAVGLGAAAIAAGLVWGSANG